MTNLQFEEIIEQIETIKREVQGKSRRKVDFIKKIGNKFMIKCIMKHIMIKDLSLQIITSF